MNDIEKATQEFREKLNSGYFSLEKDVEKYDLEKIDNLLKALKEYKRNLAEMEQGKNKTKSFDEIRQETLDDLRESTELLFENLLSRYKVKKEVRGMKEYIAKEDLLKRFSYGEADSEDEKVWCATFRRMVNEQPTVTDVDICRDFAEFLKKKNLLTNFRYRDGEADFDYADIDGYFNEFKNQIK